MTWRSLLALAAYVLLFPPLFVLAPLAGLLAASRPATFREWAWIGAAGLWLAVSLQQPGGLVAQFLNAWALFLTGGFVVVMLLYRRRLVPGALATTVFGLGAATVWVRLLGSRWQDLELAVAHAGWEYARQVQGDVSAQLADAFAQGVGPIAQLFPGLLVLMALPGLALAWAWYHRIATHPAGEPAGRFSDFRFDDHLVWLVVMCAAGTLLPLPLGVLGIFGNIVLVTGALYALRGLAVVWGALGALTISPAMGALLVLVALFLLAVLPVALGGFFAIGLADTWIDFRRRFGSADTRGSGPWK